MRTVTRYLVKNADGGYLVAYYPKHGTSLWGPKREATSLDRTKAHRIAKKLGERVIRCVRP